VLGRRRSRLQETRDMRIRQFLVSSRGGAGQDAADRMAILQVRCNSGATRSRLPAFGVRCRLPRKWLSFFRRSPLLLLR